MNTCEMRIWTRSWMNINCIDMKKTVTLIALILLSSLGWAQGRHGERIRAFKTGYLTQELELSQEEAEKFWPLYNEYENKMFELRFENRRQAREQISSQGGPEALTDEEAKAYLNRLFENEEKILTLKKDLYGSLEKVLPPAKLLKLHKAENDFNRHLLSEYKRRGHQNQKE